MAVSRRIRILLIAAGAAAAILAGAYFVLVVSLSGGMDGFLKGLKRPPEPARLEPQRNRAATTIATELDRLAAPIAPAPAAEGRHDECYRGQHNFKINDDYAHRCELQITRYYGVSGDFRDSVLDLAGRLEAQGWEGGDLERVITEYFDAYTGPGRSPRGGGHTYLVSDLPSPIGYRKPDLRIDLDYAERATQDLTRLDSAQRSGRSPFPEASYSRADLVDVEETFRAVTADHPYVIALSVKAVYFEE
jgi:hypothetical protein